MVSVDGGEVVAVAATVAGGRAIPGASEMKQQRRILQTRLVRPQRLIPEMLAHRGRLGATKRIRKRQPPPRASTSETLVLLKRKEDPRHTVRI